MMRLSPEFKAKMAKFKANKRAWYSLVILVAIFLLTLPAEMLFNDKPIVMGVDGGLFFPVFKDYTYKELGGELNVPVVNYQSDMFTNFINGKKAVVNPEVMLYMDGADGEFIRYEDGEKRSYWALNPPFRHSYTSFYSSDILARQRLIGPFGKTEDGVKTPGGIAEGHYMGTDKQGKDILARLVYGFRLSLLFGLALAITSTLIGCFLGALQGYFGGVADLGGQRLTEIWSAIPRLLLLMLLSDFLSRKGELSEFQHIIMLFIILNLTSWMGMAAHMRAMFLRARNLDYVKAAKALGVGNGSIMARHILPNSLTPIVTFLPFSVSSGILVLTSLDFLGFGLKYPSPSLGELLNQGLENLDAWWIISPTFITLCLLLILLTFVGDGVRNAFDPRNKG